MATNTLIIGQQKVRQLLDGKRALSELRSAFCDYTKNKQIVQQRCRSDLPALGTATVLFPGISGTIPAYTVKVHSKYPSRKPAIQGVILLHELESGELLAIIESSYITALRTGLVGALAAHTLALDSAKRVAVIGCGVQGNAMLGGLSMLRKIDHVSFFDINPEAQSKFTEVLSSQNINYQACSSIEEASDQAEIILIATWSKTPLLTLRNVSAGTHITTLGADEPGKSELSPELIEESIFIADDRELCLKMGAVGNAGLKDTCIAAELGEIFLGLHPGRSNDSERTIFGAVGLPFQDLVLAWQVYQSAKELGQSYEIDFLS